MINTIILKKGEFTRQTKTEFNKFNKYDTIIGENSDPEELMRWGIEQEDEAKAELAKYRCEYEWSNNLFYATEYALEYCECNEDGEFVQGSDFDFAEEKEER